MHHRYYKWREAFDAAADAKAVRVLVQDYVATLGTPLINRLSLQCKLMLRNPNVELNEAAVVFLMAEASHKGSEEDLELLHEIAHTLAAAAVRLRAFETTPTGGFMSPATTRLLY